MTTMTKRETRRLDAGVPTSLAVMRHRSTASRTVLRAAFRKLRAHGANVWVFAADERHFEQFSGARDQAGEAALTQRQRDALCAWG